MESKNAEILRKIGYIIILLVVSLPLTKGYILESGDVVTWIRRIDEVRANFRSPWGAMFPSPELVAECGGEFSALNSNLWLFFSAVLRGLGFSITNTYRVYMLLLNVIALWGTYKLFAEWTADKWLTCVGVVLFMTCPYRVYICYDKADLGIVAAWSFIPVALWSVLRLCHGKVDWKKILLAGASIAAVAYSNGILWLAVIGILMVGLAWHGKWKCMLSVLLGMGLSVPGMIKWLQYLWLGDADVVNMPLGLIAPQGYVLGQFFNSWTYREDCPGFGIGIILGLAIFGWLYFAQRENLPQRKYGFCWFVLLLTAFMSMQRFPWDILQRLGAPFLRLISLIEAPGVFFGFTCLVASGFGVCAAEGLTKQRNMFVRWSFMLLMLTTAVGICVYLCNDLINCRLPMYL